MSDIQEEQKRLYKRAEENDIKIIEPSEKECFVRIIKEYQRKVDDLQDRINKAIDFINSFEIYEPDSIDTSDYENLDILGVLNYITNILKGDNK